MQNADPGLQDKFGHMARRQYRIRKVMSLVPRISPACSPFSSLKLPPTEGIKSDSDFLKLHSSCALFVCGENI
jgi:hypothetical protein